MYEDKTAVIRVEECFLEGAQPDLSEHVCTVLACDPEQDMIRLLLNEDDVTIISLDCIYLCRIDTEEGPVYCRITFYKRYLDRRGCVICAQIGSGFSKKI